ncbi:MAG: response regulator [Nitrospira sp.]|nr:response regulator [Nitrospira sp.]
MTQTRPTIPVADDDPLSRLFVRNALAPAGMNVAEAPGGQDALVKFEALAPALVVLDIMMPDMDGYLTCSRLRTLPRAKRVPILILTGWMTPHSIAQAYRHGLRISSPKPVNATTLCHHVRYMPRTNNALVRAHPKRIAAELAQDRPDRQLGLESQDESFEYVQRIMPPAGRASPGFRRHLRAFPESDHPDDRSVGPRRWSD